MLSWLSRNLGTILITAALIGVVALIIRSLRRDRARGKSPCGSGCAGCPMAGSCHRQG